MVATILAFDVKLGKLGSHLFPCRGGLFRWRGKMSSRNRLRKNLRSALVLAAGSASVGLVDQAFGASGTWTYNGNDLWGTAAAWLNGNIGDGVDEVSGFGVGFNILDTLVVTLDINRTIGGLSFGDSDVANSPAGWRMTGAVPTLTLSAIATPTISVAALGTGNGTSQVGTLFQRI